MNVVARGFISVGAMQKSEAGYDILEFSNSDVALCAPGIDVPAARMGGDLRELSGPSMSAALAAGVAALWWGHLRSQSATTRIIADVVWKGMRASVTTDGFASNVKASERGLGLVQAPAI